MQLSLDEKIMKLATHGLFESSKVGIIGHVVTVIALLFLVSPYMDLNMLIIGISAHTIIIIKRILLLRDYYKQNHETISTVQINQYIKKYKICMFFSAIAFSLMLFFLNDAPIEYYFLLIAVLAGIASAAVYTIGQVYSVYMTYMISIIGLSIIWFILQEGGIYNIAIFLFSLQGIYSSLASYRYSRTYKKMLIREIKAKEYIYEQEQAQKKIIEQKNILDYRAHHDNLTGLPNRVLFNDRLNQGMQKAKRNLENLAVCFIDIDNFKVINDSLGHEIGDRVLKEVTKLLQKNIRSDDTLARWGGDEFIIIMEGLKSPQDASILAQKILNILSAPCKINSHELYVTSSIGISIYPKDSENADNLVKFADSAMYKAKDEGKNNYKYYSQDMTKMAFERVVMESSIRAAIKNNEFIVHYQPQVDAKNNKLIGMEALVRWNHPNLGLVSPCKFLPLAEETGLIVDIDILVMDMAMKQFSKWKQDGFNPGVLSLNLAVKYLEEENYINNLKNSMKKYSIDTRYLILELTESDIMKKPENSIKKLKEISALGINIAIDDFGTGYSSLSYLKRLPMDELKIDKSFVDYIIDNDDEGKSIVKAIIAMANTLNLVLVAEGVEEEIQKDFLLENGCNIIQGYHYSKPISPDEMLEFIKGMDND